MRGRAEADHHRHKGNQESKFHGLFLRVATVQRVFSSGTIRSCVKTEPCVGASRVDVSYPQYRKRHANCPKAGALGRKWLNIRGTAGRPKQKGGWHVRISG